MKGYINFSRHTCAAQSGPWLPREDCSSESEHCPGSDQGERSSVDHAVGKLSSEWSRQSTHSTRESIREKVYALENMSEEG